MFVSVSVRQLLPVNMLRRKPTRLELKIDDTEEFESVKKELEVYIITRLHYYILDVSISTVQYANQPVAVHRYCQYQD